MSFLELFKREMSGTAASRLVFINNFEVERRWAEGEQQLPGASVHFAAGIVSRMEELALFLAGAEDLVLLKEAVDPGYLDYLRSLGITPARQVIVRDAEARRSVTEDALASRATIADLTALADESTYLCALGTTAAEEQLAELTGLRLLSASSEIAKAVNSKIYSRRLAELLGLRMVPGAVATEPFELPELIDSLRRLSGRCVVKEAFGVSGRGQAMIKNDRQAASLARMIARGTDGGTAAFIVESWLDDAVDINYQFLVTPSGDITFLDARQAIVEAGVHRGHRFPPDFSPVVVDELHDAASRIGAALHEDGYHGVVGVDALLTDEMTLYPCLEINARFNMSTYANEVADAIRAAGRRARVAQVDVGARRRIEFEELFSCLKDRLAEAVGHRGAVVMNFATVNAGRGSRSPGRLYFLVVGDVEEEIADTQSWVETQIDCLVST